MNTYTHEGETYRVFPRKDGKGRMVRIGDDPPIFVNANTDDEALRAFGVEPGFVTLVNQNNKPMKITAGGELPKGKKVYQSRHNPHKVMPVPVIVVEKR